MLNDDENDEQNYFTKGFQNNGKMMEHIEAIHNSKDNKSNFPNKFIKASATNEIKESSSQNNSEITRERNRDDKPLKASIQTYEEMEENYDIGDTQPVTKKKAPVKKKEFLKRKKEVTAIPVETKKYNYYADNFESQKNDENKDFGHERSKDVPKQNTSMGYKEDAYDEKPINKQQKPKLGELKYKPMSQDVISTAKPIYSKQNSFHQSDLSGRSVPGDEYYNSVEEFQKFEEECINEGWIKEITNKNDKNTNNQKAKNQQPKPQIKNRKYLDASDSSESDDDNIPSSKPQTNSQANMSNVVK